MVNRRTDIQWEFKMFNCTLFLADLDEIVRTNASVWVT